MGDDNYKDNVNFNKIIENQQKMMKQIAKVSMPPVELNVNYLTSDHIKNFLEQLKICYEPIKINQKVIGQSLANFSNISDKLKKIYFNTNFTSDYISSLQAKMENLIKPSTIEAYQKMSTMYSNYTLPTESLKNFKNMLAYSYDVSPLLQALNNNIKTINSIYDNLYNGNFEENSEKVVDEILSKTQNIEFNIPFPEDTSIAEMEATINGDEYVEPEIDYKKFNVILATMSFVKDPVKACDVLLQLIYFADHSVDMSLKIQIYNVLKNEIAVLIASGIVGTAVLVAWILLDYFLKDNIIYKKFIEFKDSIKELKK